MIASKLNAVELPSVWRGPVLALLAVLSVLLLLYRDTAANMVLIWWRSETFTHAFIVPPIALWLVWRQRQRLADLVPRPQYLALLPMAALALLWLAGEVVSANSITQLALVAMLVLSVPLVLGGAVARALMFPLVFMFFAVPIGDFLTPYMMQWTADFTVQALRLSGIPVYREGLQFVIPSGNWSVVEACSGLRYLMASFMVGSLFAYLNYQTPWRRWTFVGVSIAMPILANWLRAYIIVMLGHLSDNAIATGADHLVYGWVFFGIVIMAMFFVGARWAEPEVPYQRPAASMAGGASLNPAPAARSAWAVALLAICLVLIPPLLKHQLGNSRSAAMPQLSLPATLSGTWRAAEAGAPDWQPVYAEPSAQAERTYVSGAGAVGLRIAYYRDQNTERKLVSSSNVLVEMDDRRWNVLTTGHRAVAGPGGPLDLTTTEILSTVTPGDTAARRRLLVWQWYWVGGHLTRSDMVAKLLSAWQQLSGQGDESAAVFVYTLEPIGTDTRARLDDFVQTNREAIDTLLQSVRQSR